MQKEKFPQSGCSLDTAFCLRTITGTQGAAEEAFVLQTFANADTQVGTNLMDKAEHAMLHFNAMHVYHCMITCTCAYRRASNYCIHSYIEMSVLCITLSPVKIYCAEEIVSILATLFLWLYKYLL